MMASSPPPADGQLHHTQSNTASSSVLDLPTDVIELILRTKYCPVKSVVRFKSVSKSWHSIISDPRFLISLQSRLPEENHHEHKFIVFAWAQRREACIMIVEDGKCQRESELRIPFTSTVEQLIPICSCNGLILLYGPSYTDYVLWNPLIRKHIIIPPPWKSYWKIFLLNFKHHLYYDSVTEDYKIVLVYDKGCSYVVFSCKSGSWGEKKKFPSDDNLSYGAFVDGCLYTIHDEGGIIYFFDVRDGNLHDLSRPKEAEGLFQLQLKQVSGRLCLYGFTDATGQKRLQLWVMEKNKSWRKLISMEKEDPLIQYLHPVCVTDGDDVILRATVGDGDDAVLRAAVRYGTYKNKYLLYNSRRNSCNLQDLIAWDYSDPIVYFPYSENLLMPTSTSNYINHY